MSIRLRLTLLYSAILALTLIAFSGILYTIQSRYTLNIVRNDLSMNARHIVELWSRAAHDPDRGPLPWMFWRDDARRDRGPPDAQPVIPKELRTRDTMRLLDANGAPLDLSVNEENEDLPLSQEGLIQLQNGQAWEDILRDLTGESERLIRLISDLLMLARADAGHRLACDRVSISPLINDACRQARLLEPRREIECAGPDDVTALADHDALKQVLLILLDNAVKHAEGTIRVALCEHDHQVAVSVQDDGPGMSPELCERVFDRFYRGDASRSTPGFGLGLSIAKVLVEAQGGTIEAESQVGKGSVFTVTIPKAAES